MDAIEFLILIIGAWLIGEHFDSIWLGVGVVLVAISVKDWK